METDADNGQQICVNPPLWRKDHKHQQINIRKAESKQKKMPEAMFVKRSGPKFHKYER